MPVLTWGHALGFQAHSYLDRAVMPQALQHVLLPCKIQLLNVLVFQLNSNSSEPNAKPICTNFTVLVIRGHTMSTLTLPVNKAVAPSCVPLLSIKTFLYDQVKLWSITGSTDQPKHLLYKNQ